MQEEERLNALRQYEIIDSSSDGPLKLLTEVVALAFNVPLAVITLIDSEKAYYKESTLEQFRGVKVDRNKSYCSLAILSNEVTIFKDTHIEPCLINSRELVEQIGYRFYASAPLKSSSGFNIGTVAILDKQARDLSDTHKLLLVKIATMIMDEIELRAVFRREVIQTMSKAEQLTEANHQLTSNIGQLKEANTNMAELISVAAHDLRAPLGRAKGLAELLRMRYIHESEEAEITDKIMTVSNDGLQLIDDILNKENNKVTNRNLFHNVNIHRILEDDILEHLREIAKKKSITILSNTDDSIELTTNQGALKRIVENLVANAIKFSNPNSTICVSAFQKADCILISIKDEGPGISAEDQKKMFRKFQKLSAKPTADETSTGLGLSIVKELMSELSGEIEVKSEPEQGTEFILKFKRGLKQQKGSMASRHLPNDFSKKAQIITK